MISRVILPVTAKLKGLLHPGVAEVVPEVVPEGAIVEADQMPAITVENLDTSLATVLKPDQLHLIQGPATSATKKAIFPATVQTNQTIAETIGNALNAMRKVIFPVTAQMLAPVKDGTTHALNAVKQTTWLATAPRVGMLVVAVAAGDATTAMKLDTFLAIAQSRFKWDVWSSCVFEQITVLSQHHNQVSVRIVL